MKETLGNNITFRNSKLNIAIRYLVLITGGLIMLYPILWLVGATFKTNNEIFTEISFIPNRIDFTPYIEGWQTSTEYTFGTYFLNTFRIIIPKIIGTLISATLTAYGFARFEFPFKRILFLLLISTLFLPEVVLRIPQYIMFRELGVLNTYIPLIAPDALAQNAFFVFMMVQFLRSIPIDLDEAAYIDGANSLQVLWKILLPSMKPVLVNTVIFQFIWTFNDFLGPLIYINSVGKYPVSLALQMSVDATSGHVAYNQIFAMSVIALLPSIILFFVLQKYFIGSDISSGIKG